MTDDIQQGPNFMVQRIFLIDASLEVPLGSKIFTKEWKPEMNMDLSTKASALDEKTHEVVLTVTVTVKIGEDVAFLVEVHQAGIFVADSFPKDQLGPLLGSYCPNMLYAFAREAVTNLVVKAGFPQLYLTPVNFDALYEQHLQEQTGDQKSKNSKNSKTEAVADADS